MDVIVLHVFFTHLPKMSSAKALASMLVMASVSRLVWASESV